MYRLMIVEDEYLERKALCMELAREEYHIEEIIEAANGQEALELFNEKHPDILLVDINIPVFSGLKLIDMIIKENVSCKIIITTTYDRFRYIQTAISLGVTEYLLKPVDYVELKKAVDKCQLLLEEEKRQERKFSQLYTYTQHYVLEDMLFGDLSESDDAIAEIMGIDEKSRLCMVLLLCKENCERFEQEIKKLCINEFAMLTTKRQDEVFVLLQPKNIKSQDHALAKIRCYLRMLHKILADYGIAVFFCSEKIQHFHELPDARAYLMAKADASPRNMPILPAMPTSDLCKPSEYERLGKKWEHKLYERDPERMIRSVRRRMITPESYWAGVDLFCRTFGDMDAKAQIIDLFKCFEADKPFDELSLFLKQYYNCRYYAPTQDNPFKERVLSILRRDYMKDITQKDVAKELGLNTSYFSTTFNKEMGTSFSEQLNHLRIDHAKQLLQDGEEDANKIAEACGFTNRKYFYQIFKKHTGKTFAEYLEENR